LGHKNPKPRFIERGNPIALENLYGVLRRIAARLAFILGRFHDFLLSSGDPTAATREPDSASHEHNTFFFLGTWRGTSSAAGFG
jgi:hypothetical protein